MQPAAVITFVVIASFVWGGLLLIVSTALRRESRKLARAAARTHPDKPPER